MKRRNPSMGFGVFLVLLQILQVYETFRQKPLFEFDEVGQPMEFLDDQTDEEGIDDRAFTDADNVRQGREGYGTGDDGQCRIKSDLDIAERYFCPEANSLDESFPRVDEHVCRDLQVNAKGQHNCSS